MALKTNLHSLPHTGQLITYLITHRHPGHLIDLSGHTHDIVPNSTCSKPLPPCRIAISQAAAIDGLTWPPAGKGQWHSDGAKHTKARCAGPVCEGIKSAAAGR